LRFQAGRTISTNFALREVHSAAFDKQQTHLRSIVIVIDHGVWPIDFNGNKNMLKNSRKHHYLAYILLDLFDRYKADSLYFRLESAIAMVNLAMVGCFLPNLRKKLQDDNLQ
jgi:hypothetical protein